MPEKTGAISSLVQLYNYAEDQNCDVYWYSFGAENLESVSVMEVSDGKCYIGIDPFKLQSEANERLKLAHELGHCETGSFYNEYATWDIRQKHENRADKWAIKKLIPKDELDAAVADGHTELWDLADYFDVTEGCMHKAVCWYKHGNLAVEAYC